jgi:hypothetical protein
MLLVALFDIREAHASGVLVQLGIAIHQMTAAESALFDDLVILLQKLIELDCAAETDCTIA